MDRSAQITMIHRAVEDFTPVPEGLERDPNYPIWEEWSKQGGLDGDKQNISGAKPIREFEAIGSVNPDVAKRLYTVMYNPARIADIPATTDDDIFRRAFRDAATIEQSKDLFGVDAEGKLTDKGRENFSAALLDAVGRSVYSPTSANEKQEVLNALNYLETGKKMNLTFLGDNVEAKYNWAMQVLHRAKEREGSFETGIMSDEVYQLYRSLAAYDRGETAAISGAGAGLSTQLMQAAADLWYGKDHWGMTESATDAVVLNGQEGQMFMPLTRHATEWRAEKFAFGAGGSVMTRENTGIPGLSYNDYTEWDKADAATEEEHYISPLANKDENYTYWTRKTADGDTVYMANVGYGSDGQIKRLIFSDKQLGLIRARERYNTLIKRDTRYLEYLTQRAVGSLSADGRAWLDRNHGENNPYGLLDRDSNGTYVTQASNLVSKEEARKFNALPKQEQDTLFYIMQLHKPMVQTDSFWKTVGYGLTQDLDGITSGFVRGSNRLWNFVTFKNADEDLADQATIDTMNAVGSVEVKTPYTRTFLISGSTLSTASFFLLGGTNAGRTALTKWGLRRGLPLKVARIGAAVAAEMPNMTFQTLVGTQHRQADYFIRYRDNPEALRNGLVLARTLNILASLAEAGSEYIPISYAKGKMGTGFGAVTDAIKAGERGKAVLASLGVVTKDTPLVAFNEMLQESVQGAGIAMLDNLFGQMVDHWNEYEELDFVSAVSHALHGGIDWDSVIAAGGASIPDSATAALGLVGITQGARTVRTVMDVRANVNRVVLARQVREERDALSDLLASKREANGVHLPQWEDAVRNQTERLTQLREAQAKAAGRELTDEDRLNIRNEARQMIALNQMEQLYNQWAGETDKVKQKKILQDLGFSEAEVTRFENLFEDLFHDRQGGFNPFNTDVTASGIGRMLNAMGVTGATVTDVADVGEEGATGVDIDWGNGRKTRVVMTPGTVDEKNALADGVFLHRTNGKQIDATNAITDLIRVATSTNTGSTKLVGHELAHNLLSIAREADVLSKEQWDAITKAYTGKDGKFDEERLADDFGAYLEEALFLNQKKFRSPRAPKSAGDRVNQALHALGVFFGTIARVVLRRKNAQAARESLNVGGVLDAFLRDGERIRDASAARADEAWDRTHTQTVVDEDGTEVHYHISDSDRKNWDEMCDKLERYADLLAEGVPTEEALNQAFTKSELLSHVQVFSGAPDVLRLIDKLKYGFGAVNGWQRFNESLPFKISVRDFAKIFGETSGIDLGAEHEHYLKRPQIRHLIDAIDDPLAIYVDPYDYDQRWERIKDRPSGSLIFLTELFEEGEDGVSSPVIVPIKIRINNDGGRHYRIMSAYGLNDKKKTSDHLRTLDKAPGLILYANLGKLKELTEGGEKVESREQSEEIDNPSAYIPSRSRLGSYGLPVTRDTGLLTGLLRVASGYHATPENSGTHRIAPLTEEFFTHPWFRRDFPNWGKPSMPSIIDQPASETQGENGDAGEERRNHIKVWSGAPQEYDHPDILFIGSGTGGQNEGYGLYASGVLGVARDKYARSYIPKNPKTWAQLPVNGDRRYKTLGEFGKKCKTWAMKGALNPEENIKIFFAALANDAVSGKIPKGNVKETLKKAILEELEREGKAAEDFVAWGRAVMNHEQVEPKTRRQEMTEARAAQLYKTYLALGFNQESVLDEQINALLDVPVNRPAVMEQTWFTNRPEGDVSHLLSWFEPVTDEQRKWVGAAYDKRFADFDGYDYWKERIFKPGIIGKDFYKELHDLFLNIAHRSGMPTTDWVVQGHLVKFLLDADIDGTRYPVDYRHGHMKGELGWNYVAFSDEHLRVDHVYEYNPETDAFEKKWHEAEGAAGPRFTETPLGQELVAHAFDVLVGVDADLLLRPWHYGEKREPGKGLVTAGLGRELDMTEEKGFAAEVSARISRFGTREGDPTLREIRARCGSKERFYEVMGAVFEAAVGLKLGVQDVITQREFGTMEKRMPLYAWVIRHNAQARATALGRKAYIMGRRFAERLHREALAEARAEVERQRTKASEARAQTREAKAQTRNAERREETARIKLKKAEFSAAEADFIARWRLAEERAISRMRIDTIREAMKASAVEARVREARKRAVERERGVSFQYLKGTLGVDIRAELRALAGADNDPAAVAGELLRKIELGFDKWVREQRPELIENSGSYWQLLNEQGEKAYRETMGNVLKAVARELSYGKLRESILNAVDLFAHSRHETVHDAVEGKLARVIAVLRIAQNADVVSLTRRRIKSALAEANKRLSSEASSARTRYMTSMRRLCKELLATFEDAVDAQGTDKAAENRRKKLTALKHALEDELEKIDDGKPIEDLAKDETLTERQHKDAVKLMFLERFGDLSYDLDPEKIWAKAAEAEGFVRDALFEHVIAWEAKKQAAAEMSAKLMDALPQARGWVKRGSVLFGALIPSWFDRMKWPLMGRGGSQEARARQGQAARAVIDDFERRFAQAALSESRLNRMDGDAINKMAAKAYGLSGATDAETCRMGHKKWMDLISDREARWANELSLDGMPLSRANLIYIYASLRQEDVHDKMAHNYNAFAEVDEEGKVTKAGIDVYLERVKAELTGEDLVLADLAVKFFAMKRVPLSEISSRLFGLPVYSPVADYVPLSVQLEDGPVRAQANRMFVLFPNFLKNRVWHSRKLDETKTIYNVLQERSLQQNRWMAYAELYQLSQMVFNNPDVAAQYKKALGATAMKGLQKQFNEIFAGLEQSSSTGVKWLRSMAAVKGLGFNAKSAVRQWEGVAAWAVDMGIRDTAGALKDALACLVTAEGRKQWADAFRSDIVRTRMETGTALEQRQIISLLHELMAASQKRTKAAVNMVGALQKFSNASFMLLKYSDAIVCAMGIVGLRPRLENKWMGLGYSREEARRLAMQDLDVMVQRLQQSGRPEYLSSIQRGGAFGAALTMFTGPAAMSAGIYAKAFRDLWMAVRDGDAALRREALSRLGGVMVRNLAYGLLMWFTGGFFVPGDMDEEDETQFRLAMTAFSMVFGGFGGLFLFGALANTAQEMLSEWMVSGEPPDRFFQRLEGDLLRMPVVDMTVGTVRKMWKSSVEFAESDKSVGETVRFALEVPLGVTQLGPQVEDALEYVGVQEDSEERTDRLAKEKARRTREKNKRKKKE